MNNSELKQFINLVPFLGKVLGQPFEIILFDVSDYKFPIITSYNIKDSSVEKAREFVQEVMNVEDIETRTHWINHPVSISQSKMSKMSVYLIRDEKSTIISALVICMGCDEFFRMESYLSSILQFNNTDIESGSSKFPNVLSRQPEKELSLDIISEYIQEFGVEPNRTNHDEKSEIICDLYDTGIYNLKGAVAKTAEELGISTKSVYRYISKIKKARD